MIGFMKDTWYRLRTPNDKGRVMFWPLAALAVAFVSLFYGVSVSIGALFGWFWRRVLSRLFGGSPGDRPGDACFQSNPTGHPSGAGGVSNQQTAQQTEQAQIAHERAMERAWAEEMEMQGMAPEYYEDDPFGEFDPRHHPRRERGHNGGHPTVHNREMGFHPHHPHNHHPHQHHHQQHQHHPHRERRHGRNRRRRRHFHRGGSPRMRILFG